MSRQDTKRRILDAAEHVFARDGYRGASLRAVTGRAGVNLAAVNYHFGSKEDLLRALFERRIVPLNEIRRARMEAVLLEARRSGRRPEVRAIVDALVKSAVSPDGEAAGYARFHMIMGRSMAEPDGTVRRVFHAFNQPVVGSLRRVLRRALPAMDGVELYWRTAFAIGALIMAQRFRANPPPDLPAGAAAVGGEQVAELPDFIAAGLEKPGKRGKVEGRGRNAAAASGVEKSVRHTNQAGRGTK